MIRLLRSVFRVLLCNIPSPTQMNMPSLSTPTHVKSLLWLNRCFYCQKSSRCSNQHVTIYPTKPQPNVLYYNNNLSKLLLQSNDHPLSTLTLYHNLQQSKTVFSSSYNIKSYKPSQWFVQSWLHYFMSLLVFLLELSRRNKPWLWKIKIEPSPGCKCFPPFIGRFVVSSKRWILIVGFKI